MDSIHRPFTIHLTHRDGDRQLSASVCHESETFDVEIEGIQVSLINNGDNSWSAVENVLDQETVNEIGAAIEAHYARLPL